MNFRKWFTPQPERLTLQRLKTQSWLILIFCSFQFVSFFGSCIEQYYFDTRKINIKVNNISNVNTYKNFTAGNGIFVTGTEGTLYYNAKSFSEMLLFEKFRNKSLLDSFFYLVLGFIIFLSIRRITEIKTFSEKLMKTLGIIIMLLLIFPLLSSWFDRSIVEKTLQNRTNNMLELADREFLGTDYVLMICFLGMFLYFIKKGTELQQEQDLTV